MVSQQLLQELQTIFKEDYGRNLKMDEISSIGAGLINLFEFLQKHRTLISENSEKNASEKDFNFLKSN